MQKQQYAGAMHDYLEALLHSSTPQPIQAADLPEEIRDCTAQFDLLTQYATELHEFVRAIASGNLDADPPNRSNALCWGLKALRSNFRHLTWQAQQIAKGDYQHRVEFMGEFSRAFNEMVEVLEVRRASLQQAASSAEQRSLELAEMQNTLRYIMDQIDDAIIVVKPGSKRVLFRNAAFEQWWKQEPASIDLLQCHLAAYDWDRGRTWKISEQEGLRALEVISFPIVWRREQAVVHLLTDVSQQNAYNRKIEREANTDPMTGLYNRRYCLARIEQLLNERAQFCLCFIDLNNLKGVNDIYGHGEGDRYILRVSKTFFDVFRKSDTICRYAGDEFIVILPDCPKQRAELRMQEALLRLANYKASVTYEMSFCYGVEEVSGGTQRSIQDIIDRADFCMYEKKRTLHAITE